MTAEEPTTRLTSRRFENRAAVVTGAAHGIGAEVCRRLAAEGALVVLLDIDRADVGIVANEILASGGVAYPLAVDVRSPAAVAEAVETAAREVGQISVLANCAGVVRYGTVVDTTIDDWELQIGTNLTGAFLMCRNVIPHMQARGGGAIVNIASVQAFASQPLVAAYAASKGGLVSLSKTIALDHAPEQITVNVVCPGSIETPMLRYGAELFGTGDADETMKIWGKSHPIGYLGQPSDVASVVLFLLSDEARFVTGAVVAVDGGLLARLAV
jgi:NAD(P)-dependent dehydrogenase (short-subunit alcohol dehydrogenase family)